MGELPPQQLSMEEVTQHLREMITQKFFHIAKAFAEMDYAKIGVVSREDFQEVLYRFTVRLTKDQVCAQFKRPCF